MSIDLTQPCFNQPDSAFDQEVKLLTDQEKCFSVLMDHLQKYKAEFVQQLEKEYRQRDQISGAPFSIESKQNKLNLVTSSFFHDSKKGEWKQYPVNQLTGKYVGHTVCFFNMSNLEAQNASDFSNHLKKEGFDANVSKTKKGPSVLVDLTNSNSVESETKLLAESINVLTIRGPGQ